MKQLMWCDIMRNMSSQERRDSAKKVKRTVPVGRCIGGIVVLAICASGIGFMAHTTIETVRSEKNLRGQYPITSPEQLDSARNEIVIFEKSIRDAVIADENFTSPTTITISDEDKTRYLDDLRLVDQNDRNSQELKSALTRLHKGNDNAIVRTFMGMVFGGIGIVGLGAGIENKLRKHNKLP